MTGESGKKTQLWAQVEPGLRAAVEARAVRDGLNTSIVVRRAVMEHLNVDANGVPRDVTAV